MATSTQLAQKVAELRANPIAIKRMLLGTLENLTDNEVIIIDPTNPFVFLMEASVSMASATMLDGEALTRQQYPSLAQTENDLYYHMSDADYLNRFYSPARTTFTVLLSLDEIKSKAVDMGNDMRKLTIPKHTEFLAADMTFTMQYPIDIIVMPSGAVNVRYDAAMPSPLYLLTSTTPDWGIGSIRGTKFLRLTIPVQQMLISSQMAQLNNLTGFSRSFTFSDKFYYARAFTKNAIDSDWKEIATTHTEQVYDQTTPTVALKVLDQELSVHVPQIYFNNGLIKDSLRIDIYTTKGALDFSLTNYTYTSFGARWLDHDYSTDNEFSKALQTFAGIAIFSESTVTGGSNGVSFTELRDRVVKRAIKNPDVPITPAQLANNLAVLGYDLVQQLDNVTDRYYLATRSLPAPTNGSTVTGAGCAVQTLQTTITALTTHSSSVTDNNGRVTIKPNTLYKSDSGVLSVVSQAVIDAMVANGPESLAQSVNDGSYYYSPFYYVLDTSQEEFQTRAYRFDKPKVVSKFFWQENTTLQMDASTKDYVLLVNDSIPGGKGFVLVIEVAAGEVFKSFPLDQVFVQLSYVPPGAYGRIHINGELVSPIDPTTEKPVDDRYIYHFALDSNYDVDVEHKLVLEPYGTSMNLTTEFDLVYIVKDHLPPGALLSAIDDIMDDTILPNYDPSAPYRAYLQEKIGLKFGDYLEHLWTRSRTVVEETKYLTYSNDVKAYYTSVVLLRDSTGNIVFDYDSNTEQLTYTVLYNIGDPVLTATGDAAWRTAKLATPSLDFTTWWNGLTAGLRDSYHAVAHRTGENILDQYGKPQPVNGQRGLKRQTDLFLIDGKYYFATNDSTTTYRDEVTDLITSWVTTDIDTISGRLLERTKLFFYPKTTVGTFTAIVGDGRVVQVSADQHFVVQYYMMREKYDNADLKAQIERKTAEVLPAAMTGTTIAVSSMVAMLSAAIGDDVISIDVYSNVFGTSESGVVRYPAITLTDQSMRPSVGKRLLALSNQTIVVQDSVTVEFVPHR
jgi:hypothetical protein